MKEDVIIIHGYMAHGNSVWIPWLVKELEERGHRVWHPDMPNTDHPKLKEWLKTFDNIVSKTDRELVIIGHSLGGALILKLLGQEQEWMPRLKKAIVLGAPTHLRAIAPDFFTPPLDWKAIDKYSDKLTAVWSTDDERVPKSHISAIKENTNAKTVILENHGHFLIDKFEWLLSYLEHS